MKYRIKETTYGDGRVEYSVQSRHDGLYGFFAGWGLTYGSGGLNPLRGLSYQECLRAIASLQQEDRDNAVKKTRYVAEGVDVLLVPVEDIAQKSKRGY